MAHRRTGRGGVRQTENERRIRTSIFLPRLTVADGEWLAHTLPAVQRNARPQPQAVRIEDIALRYRSGSLGIADALDATSELLEPFAAAGACLDHRSDWYIADDDEDDDELFESDRPTTLDEAPEQDLLVSGRVVIDATAEDAGAAALYWVVIALANNEE